MKTTKRHLIILMTLMAIFGFQGIVDAQERATTADVTLVASGEHTMANGKKDLYSDISAFHAGRFLCDVLQEEGHDRAWLADRLNIPLDIFKCILEQPNMDAELFVRIGHPMNPLFMQRVNEMMFGNEMVKPVA